MAFLAHNSPDGLQAGLLTRRVLIGRRLSHGVILSDPSVSRLHAWVDRDGPDWVVTDAGSKTGTFVNGKQVYRQALHDGDELQVGAVGIRFQLADTLPRDARPVELSPPDGNVKTSGILFDCGTCGSPLWVANDLAGKRGLCRHCKKPVTVPDLYPAFEPKSAASPRAASSRTATAKPDAPRAKPRMTATPVAAAAPAAPPSPEKPKTRLHRCAVCHSSIQPNERMTTCPECAMHFHTECWQENYGCSSYGCTQVNILNPQAQSAAIPHAVQESTTDTTPEETDSDTAAASPESSAAAPAPWGLIAVAASVLASVLGVIAFGIPAAVVAVWSLILVARGRVNKTMPLLAIVICLIGIAAGLVFSDIRYFNARHLPFKI